MLPLAALDFGVNIVNESGFTGDDTAVFVQKDVVTLWLTQVAEDWMLKVEGFYQFTGNFAADASTVIPLRLDVGDLYFQAQVPVMIGAPGLLLIRAGRFDYTDLSGKIFNAPTDGVYARYSQDTLEFSLLGAYTGLTAQQDANIVISAADFAQYDQPADADTFDPELYFAPDRLVAAFRFKVLELLERHDLGVDLVGQFDLRPTGAMHTFYAQLQLEGRPLQWLKWRAYGVGELWVNEATAFSMAAGGKLQLTFPDVLGLVAVAGFDWASGQVADGLSQYGAITQEQVGSIYSAVFADTMAANLRASLRPAAGLELGLNAWGIMRASGNAPQDEDFPATGTAWYLGTEGLMSVDLTLSSELKLGIKAGAFLPNTAADAYGADALPRLLAALRLDMLL